MDTNIVNQFSFNFKEVLLDEISLEGLEGVGFDLLWRRVEKRIFSPVTDKMKVRFWGFLLHCDSVQFYKIPEPLPYVEIKDRFDMVDEETGNVLDPPELLDGPYTYEPAEDDYGSAIYYKTRKIIPKKSLEQIPFEKVVVLYGDKLVIVASLEERWKALVPHVPMNYLKDMSLTRVHYCLLELIGKSRENGQMTVGNTNLTKIVKDSKLMFYNRKFLQKFDLIRVQFVSQVNGNRSVKGILLRLRRFHQPELLSMPKHGKVHDIAEYLMTQPNYSDTCKNIFDSNVADPAFCKRLSKCENSFIFENFDGLSKKKSKQLVNRRIRLDPPSEDDSHSEDESPQELKCQYQVKVNLQRQAYERILEAGLNGLSQIEVAELLGVEYYTARTICRTFKHKNIVKEIFVDRGKQRTAKFVAAASASAVNAKYEEEKKKFFEYVDESKNAVATRNISELPDDKQNESEDEIPKKKPRLKIPKGIEDIMPDTKTIERTVSEVKFLDGFENADIQPFLGPGKAPTMRQLRYANGILKTIQEKCLVSGYMHLNSLASKESNEPLMDNKCLKRIIQKLVREGQIKLLKMTWPAWHKACTVFCAPHVQITDSIVNAKYKEISLSMLRNKRVEKQKKERKEPEALTRPLAMSVFPRYLKLQKLHEFLIKMVYFNDDESYCTIAPEGFSSLVDMIPEFTVEFVIGNMSAVALMAMQHVQIPQNMMPQKLRNVPGDLFKTFLATPTLQNGWRQNLKVLSTLGLLQLIKSPTASDENFILSYEFYINRYASIIDTTGEWPRENADIEALRRTYHFKTFEDVERYWKDVHEISVNTTVCVEQNQRSRKQPFYVPRLREEVHENDNGQVYGNGLGPCGFDSTFFMEIPKLWAMSSTKLKHHALYKKPVIKMPKRKKPGKPKKPKPIGTIRKRRAVKPPSDTKRKRQRPPTTSMPKWSKDDDRIIMLCKAAITVISPVAHSGCLRLRNLVAKDILTLSDPKKIAANCHKRATALETNTTLAYEKDCAINELKRYPAILRRYEGIFKTLRLQYCGQISKVIVAARLPMLELVYLMLQLIKSDNFNKKVECVALNLEDFYKNYTICPSTVNRNFNSYRTPSEEGPVLATIKEAIIVAIMTTYRVAQSSEVAKKIHGMFSVYPEQTLRPAIEQLRKAGAVAAREKTMNNSIHKFHFQDIAQSSYKLSTAYTRHWICRMNAEFGDNLMFSLDDDLPKSDLKGNPEMNCLLFESQAADVLDINCVTVPEITGSGGSLLQEEQLSVSEMIVRYKIKPGAVGCTYKKDINKFPELFQDLEYENALETLLRQSQINKPPENIDEKDKIVSYLKTKNKSGCTFEELQKATGYDKAILTTELENLESQNIVKRLGYFENLIVLSKYAKPWSVTVKDKQVIPTPWITLDCDIRNDVFLKWAGIIVNKVFMKPGCSIAYIAEECEFLTTRSAQDVCMVLEKCKCVVLKCVNVSEPDLFSEEVMPMCEDFNPYTPVENILVFPVKNMLTRYSYLRKKMFDDEYYFEKT